MHSWAASWVGSNDMALLIASIIGAGFVLAMPIIAMLRRFYA